MKKYLIILSLFILGACGNQVIDNSKSDAASTVTPPPMISSSDQMALPKKGEQIAIINTAYGDIKIKFFPEFAPETVKNFIELSKKGFYNGLIFHRVISDFMIQGGDPLGVGIGGETYKGPGTVLLDEIDPILKHLYGTISMANSGPNSAKSQFFIVQAKNGTPWLNGRHAIFGQIFEGMDTVEKIVKVDRDANDKPKEDVKMIKVTVKNYE